MRKNKPLRPLTICLFMVSCLAVLSVLSMILPSDSTIGHITLRWPQIKSVLGLVDKNVIYSEQEEVDFNAISGIDSAVMIQQGLYEEPAPIAQHTEPSEEQQIQTDIQTAIQTNQIDDIDTHVFLDAFYQSLAQADEQTIRVIHYGDSQIEEDRLTMQLRRALQKEYGGGGVGLIPLHQTIPTRTLSQNIRINGQTQTIKQGPKRHTVYGPRSFRRSNSIYGPMGQVAIMDNALVSGSEDIELQVNTIGRSTERYFNRIRIFKDGNITASTNNALDKNEDLIILPDSSNSATIHLQGQGDIYGISLETDRGIIVDNIPMRGSSGIVFTSMASDDLQQFFEQSNTKLIILQFGGNVMPYTNTRQQVISYIENMRTQIQYIKYLAPNSSIVFVGPSDMVERHDGELKTHHMLPTMDNALQKMALLEEIGYFSLFQHMGGVGSMVKWHDQGLAGGDYVHFTPKGADKAGEMLANWILNQ